MIEVRNLQKSYGELDVLAGVSLRVEQGEFVSILGPSGCGKSTLFSILTGVEPADGGAILIDGAAPAEPR